MLTDGAWYTLPDGTLVVAIETSNGRSRSWRLDPRNGQPAYLLSERGGWMSLRYNAADDAYEVAPCDLTDGDLEPAF